MNKIIKLQLRTTLKIENDKLMLAIISWISNEIGFDISSWLMYFKNIIRASINKNRKFSLEL
jgi:hypothetical protein